jgi:CDP-glucose 4,6-dehydratase
MESLGTSYMNIEFTNKQFWKDKRVFITGHTGFKGAWLCLWLQSLGAKVTGFALNPPSETNLFEVAKVGSNMQSILGDVRDAALLQKALLEAKPDIVFHLAAQALVLHSYQDPVETYSTNIMGTVNLLEALRKSTTVKAAVIVTSDKCYDNKEWHWGYRENDPMGGFDPYSSSKGCAELITESYRNSFFNPQKYHEHGIAIASARAGNVIGGGDWADDRLIPDLIKAFTKGEPVKLRNPASVRPWQHVLEPLNAYMLLAERLYDEGNSYAEAWNFGPNEADTKSTGWLVERIASSWGGNVSYLIQHDENAVHEALYLRLDCSKARSKLGWYPVWSIEDAVVNVTDWYQAYLRKEDMQTFSLKQIQQYQEHRSAIWTTA